ncbi:MAG TPA: response regulator transcription factor [Pyrinomonadaceae bacterium]
MNKLRILLAEDHETIRDGLKLLINSQPGMEVIAEADNGQTAIQLSKELLPDVIVMDVSMPKLNGIQATRKLKESCPELKVLILTRHKESGYLQQLLASGASGYVLKQSKSAELLRAIQAVADGLMYLDPGVTENAVSRLRESSGRAPQRTEPHASLSAREIDVLRLIALGYINKEVADQLNLSIKTVEAHRAKAMQKMGFKSRVEVVRYAILKDWLSE